MFFLERVRFRTCQQEKCQFQAVRLPWIYAAYSSVCSSFTASRSLLDAAEHGRRSRSRCRAREIGGTFEHVGQGELGSRRARRTSPAARPGSPLASGPYCAKKSLLASRAAAAARSRRVRSGALKARWQSRSNGSASGCLAASASSSKSMPRSASCLDDLGALSAGSAQRAAQVGGGRAERAHLLGRVVGVAARREAACRRGRARRPGGRRSRPGRRRSRTCGARRSAAR